MAESAPGLVVHAPLAGRVLALADLPDPVFAEAMVGPGLAIDPVARTGRIDVASPLAGKVGALHPHAFAVETGGGAALVHLGLDTVTLNGAPFTVRVNAGQAVGQGEIIVEWQIEEIGALSPVVPVVALGARHVALIAEPGTEIESGAPLFRIDAA